jgi:hypothetical protein
MSKAEQSSPSFDIETALQALRDELDSSETARKSVDSAIRTLQIMKDLTIDDFCTRLHLSQPDRVALDKRMSHLIDEHVEEIRAAADSAGDLIIDEIVPKNPRDTGNSLMKLSKAGIEAELSTRKSEISGKFNDRMSKEYHVTWYPDSSSRLTHDLEEWMRSVRGTPYCTTFVCTLSRSNKHCCLRMTSRN